jgi:hypothetical protein
MSRGLGPYSFAKSPTREPSVDATPAVAGLSGRVWSGRRHDGRDASQDPASAMGDASRFARECWIRLPRFPGDLGGLRPFTKHRGRLWDGRPRSFPPRPGAAGFFPASRTRRPEAVEQASGGPSSRDCPDLRERAIRPKRRVGGRVVERRGKAVSRLFHPDEQRAPGSSVIPVRHLGHFGS